jgi:hypothetical protein
MKRMMIAMLSLVLTVPALAQYGRPHYYSRPPVRSDYRPYQHPDVYFGLRLGGALSTVNSDDPYLDGGSMKSGLNVGMVVGFQMGYHAPVYFETGLSYIEKGGEGSFEGSKFTYGLNYLETPLVVKYKHHFDPNFSIQPFLGGYMSVGVGGKIKDFNHRQAYSSFDNEGFNRFDGGLKIGCGVQFGLLYGEVGCDIGLANISHDYFDTSRTTSLYTTIGLNF